MSSTKPFLNLNKYKVVKSLGEGTFGDVFLVQDRDSQIIYAAKISKEAIVEVNEENSDDILFLFREIKIMSALNHPSIIRYIGYNPKNFDGKPNPTIIIEYASNGTLGGIIQKELSKKPPNNWNDTKKLICIYGIASGMAYLHRNNVIHRDLKPDNILMDENFFPKITDFGLSKIQDSIYASLNIQSQAGSKGSPLFMAPEIMCEEAYSNGSDVYAFAMILFILITGTYPFSRVRNLVELMTKLQTGQRPKIPSDTPFAYSSLIERCWSQDVNDRPSFDEIVEELKTNPDFITENVDENEFKKFIELIENYETSFDITNTSFHLDNFIGENAINKPAAKETNQSKPVVKETLENKPAAKETLENKPVAKVTPQNKPAMSELPHKKQSVKLLVEDETKNECKNADALQAKSSSFNEQSNQHGKKIKKCNTLLPESPPLLVKEPPLIANADIKLKVTFVGDKTCGKQQLICCLLRKPIPAEVTPTNGPVEYTHDYFKESVNFEINDSTGQEDFILSRQNTYSNTNIFVFVFSLLNKETLKNIKTKWKDDITDYKENSVSLLVGVDLEKWSSSNSQYVTQSEIDEVEQIIGAKAAFKCSYTTSENTDKLKNKIVESYIMNFYQKEGADEKDSPKKKKKSKKEIQFKVLLVGNSNSGKFELLDYLNNEKVTSDTNQNQNPLRKIVKNFSFHGKKVDLNIFGTPNNENLQAIRLLTYRDADVVMLVFSLITKETFHTLLRNYLKEVKNFANKAAIILVGVDLEKWEKNDYNRDFVHDAELQIVSQDPDVQQILLCSYVTGENLNKISEKIVEAYQMKTNDKSCNIA